MKTLIALALVLSATLVYPGIPAWAATRGMSIGSSNFWAGRYFATMFGENPTKIHKGTWV